MATGKMSWQIHNQKHLPSYGLPGGSDGGGDMQDMHLKMSKKIAQLTKVIYALNTKNDEHEAAMSALKDAHEEEMQQMLTETAAKIQQYRLKIGDELDLRRKVKNLEECVRAFEKEKKQALVEIDAHSRITAEREVEKERDYERKINEITKDMLETKAAFEQRIQDFENIVTNLEREKHKNMDSVTSDYKRQVDELKHKLLELERSSIEDKKNVSSFHDLKVKRLQDENDNLQQELRKVIDESEGKLDKAKAFYEHELAVLQASKVSDDELSEKWKQREMLLKQEATKVELTLKTKLKELTNELSIQREEVTHLMQQLNQSKSEANSTVDHIKDLRDQLGKLQLEYCTSTDKVKYLEEELSASKSRVESQANDILRKSNIIGTLEAIKLTQEESIHGLEEQMKDLKRRMQDVEAEKSALLNSQSDENSQLIQQLKILGQRIDSLTNEKAALQKQFKHDLEEMKISHEEENESLKQQFENEANAMAKSHHSEIAYMKSEAKDAMDKMLREMEERLDKEAAQLEGEKSAEISKLEEEKKLVERNLCNVQLEVDRLNKLVERHESGLGDASSHITSLKSRIAELENDVMTTEAQHKTSEATVAELRAELQRLSETNQRTISTLNSDHQLEIEKKKREWDEKWETELREKLSALQSRLNEQHHEERRSALNELEVMKNREMDAFKTGWEEQIKQLTNQMSEMNQAFEVERNDFKRKLEGSLSDMTDMERKLRNESERAANEYLMKVNHLNESHEMALATVEQRKVEELRVLENRLSSQHREEMHSQLRAQQISIEGMKDKFNREKQEELERKDREFQEDMDELRDDMSHQHAIALDDVRRQCEIQLAAAKMELEQLQETKQRNEEHLNQKLNDLETDLRLSTADVNRLRDKFTEQNEMLSTLNKELEQKGQEILRVRSEANLELRRREEEITHKFQTNQDKYEAETIRQKQAMLFEFNKATEVLKDKIASLKLALREADDRYERRESRPEDIDLINQLKSMLKEREEQMQKLVDDKKFYQMELVNRETNFNKVFTSSPNVGVLDPRSSKKKKVSNTSAPPRFSSQFVSVPNLSSIEPAMNGSNRLEPLRAGSNSPNAFNKHLQPTPPPHPKKFLR